MCFRPFAQHSIAASSLRSSAFGTFAFASTLQQTSHTPGMLYAIFFLTLHIVLCKVISEVNNMATNLNIDMKLLDEVYQIGNFKTKKEAVNVALKEYIQKHRQKDMLKFLNKVDFDNDYDYKKARNR